MSRPPKPEHQRFEAQYEPGPLGCWLWKGTKDEDGYGKFSFKRGGWNVRVAHRYAYELYVGHIPKGLTLDHLCRVRHCVNPAHLEPVTNHENLMRGVSPSAINSRKTHCPQGHAYDGLNVRGHRVCNRCANENRARNRKAAVLV